MQDMSASQLKKLNKYLSDREKLALKIDAIRQAAHNKADAQIVRLVRKGLGNASKNSAEFLEGLEKILEAEKQVAKTLKRDAASKSLKDAQVKEA